MLRDETNLSQQTIYIGRTLFVHRDGKVNRIEPLAKATEHGWQLIQDAKSIFPDEGLVFTNDRDLAGRQNYFVLFTVIKNVKDGGPDSYFVKDSCEPYEIIRSFSNHSPDEQREIAKQRGIERGIQTLPRLVLPLSKDTCIFPKVKPDNDGKWLLAISESEERIETFVLPDDQFGANLALMGRYFALPGRWPNKLRGAVNWQSDFDCIQAICKTIKKTEDVIGGELSSVNQTVLRRLATAYQNGDLLSGDGRLSALHERLGLLLPKLNSAIVSVSDIAIQLSASPAVTRRIDVLVEQEKDRRLEELEGRLRIEIAGRIETEFSDEQDRIDALRREAVALQEQKATIEAAIAKLHEDHKLVGNELRGTLTGALEDLRRSGEGVQTLLDVARKQGIVAKPGATLGAELAPWTKSASKGEAKRILLGELPEQLQTVAKRKGLDRKGFVTLDIAARAGEVPVIEGDGADLMIAAYADGFTAGAVYRMPIDPTILGITDLWSDAQRGGETPLTIAWKAALAEPDVCHLIVLDRVDSANLADWLPLFREYFRRERPANLIAVATRGTTTRSEDSGRNTEIVVKATGSVKSAAAYLIGGPNSAIATMLSDALLDDLTDEEAQSLTAICVDQNENALRIAVRLRNLVRATKCWIPVDTKSERIPLEMLGISLENEVAKNA